MDLNLDVVKGKFDQLTGSIKEKWGDLTDDDFKKAEGSLEKLAGIIQEKYGLSKKEAMKQLEEIKGKVSNLL